MSNPLVSILICTYNAEATIENTLLSCLQQTYRNIEILVHDDASTDDTINIVKKISDPRVRIMDSGKKLGPYVGLNFLLDHAKGLYIAIQDHDDLRHNEKIFKQVAFLEEYHEFVGCGTKTLMWYEGDQKGFEYYLGGESFYTIHPSLLFRNAGYRYTIESVYMNDALFQKKVLCNGAKKIANINETLTLHRIKAGSKNYSYKRFALTKRNVQTLLYLHPLWYACCALGWEMMRIILYPVLRRAKKGYLIDRMERIPFIIQGYTIHVYAENTLKSLKFIQ